MKIIFIVFIIIVGKGYAQSLKDLEAKIAKSFTSKNLALLDSCYSRQDVHFIHRDMDSFYWRGVFKRHKAENVKFKSIKWFDFDDISDQKVKEEATRVHSMRGRSYMLNLKVLGAFKVTYVDDFDSNTNWLLAGKNKKGRWKLVTTKVVEPDKPN